MDRTSSPELLVGVSRAAGPLHAQLEAQLRAAVRSGRLPAGERLPSSRALAAELGVSRGVVVEAYGQLAAEGYLAVRPGAAPRVAAGAAAAPAAYAQAGSSARAIAAVAMARDSRLRLDRRTGPLLGL